MTNKNELLLSQCTVRLKESASDQCIGTGILYYHRNLKNKCYVITAAHNLYADQDQFKRQRQSVIVEFWNSKDGRYHQIKKEINHKLVINDPDRDLAVLVFDKNEIELIVESLPLIEVVKERHNATKFIVKGFPNATAGNELTAIHPVWVQSMNTVEKFQLQLTEDYTSWAIQGFSGSGIFINDDSNIYLYGIFTRLRPEEKGKVIYGQFVHTINNILEENYLPTIPFSFYTTYGLTPSFFIDEVIVAVKNLGPRYNEELNFRLPISLLFNDLAKDDIFKKRLQIVFDKWLTSKERGYGIKDNEVISEIEMTFMEIKNKSLEWLTAIDWQTNERINIISIVTLVSKLIESINKKIDQLYELQRTQEKTFEIKKRDYSYRAPYESEIHRMRELADVNYAFLNEISLINVELANNPCLIIQGEAGCGKSHLLGDVALDRNKKGHPTLLLLGQLFKKGQNIWQNILGQLSINISKTEFLSALNEIGKQTGFRILLLIDAINEGAGRELWPDELSGFIEEFKKFPFIGLALTVRSTYYDDLVSDQLQNDKTIIKVAHQGFKGNEYTALRMFAEHFELEQPNFPILTPEFSNPLFLQLICQSIKEAGLNKFPQGFEGISTLFDRYLNAIINNIVKRREEYKRRHEIIRLAINKMAEACFNHEDNHMVSLEETHNLFDNQFSSYKFLLDDLILENVFIQSVTYNYQSKKKIEVVYFAYERLGDYYMADYLLKQFKSSQEVLDAFQPGKILGTLVKEAVFANRGILEIMAVILPERFQLEIIEVYSWVFNYKHEDLIGNTDEWLNRFLLESFKWRKAESVNYSKIVEWFKSKKVHIDPHEWFNTLVELSTQHRHPLNSDRLYLMLSKSKMPERDSFWQIFLRYYSGKDDKGNGFPIRRLIDWAWQKNISEKVDVETARLAAQTLTWILSTTDRSLRDQTTKALVNLLEECPDALLNILVKFEQIDDFYISERLYAVAYGCALRTSSKETLYKIAQYVFNSFYTNRNPPTHILLRDYAKNIVEFAIYNGMILLGDQKLIKPPYKSKMPSEIPREEEMEIFELNREDQNFEKDYSHYHNQIKHSVMSWDFGRYTISSALSDFSNLCFTHDAAYIGFLKKLNNKKRTTIQSFQELSKLKALYIQENRSFIHLFGEKKYSESLKDMEFHLSEINSSIKEILSDIEYGIFTNIALQQTENLVQRYLNNFQEFNPQPIKRWIVKRVFDLGYDSKLHGHYEWSISNLPNQSEKVERIGKKYQWIALHESIAMVADNYWAKVDRWSNKPKLQIYPGPWVSHLRDIDPSFITRNPIEEDENELEAAQVDLLKWWMDNGYNYWDYPPTVWVNNTDDLPDPLNIIERKDDSKKEWLYLHANFNWKEPKPLGKERYRVARKEIWYLIQSYFVKKTQKHKILSWLGQKNFWGRWMPEQQRANSNLINRENYWSEASKSNFYEKWSNIDGCKYKVMLTTSEAVGNNDQDKSGAQFVYDMPCKLLFESLRMKYGKEDGSFLNENGDIIAINPDQKGILISKKSLLKFLEENDLEIIWIILGEKNSIGSDYHNMHENHFKVKNGVYFLEKNLLSGKLTLANRE
jgi:hypothetical protein